jgi:hypothetical protein
MEGTTTGRVGNKLTRECWSRLHHKLHSMRLYWGGLLKSNIVKEREEMNLERHITKITTFSSDIHQTLFRTSMWAIDGVFILVWSQCRCCFTQRDSSSDEPSINLRLNLHVFTFNLFFSPVYFWLAFVWWVSDYFMLSIHEFRFSFPLLWSHGCCPTRIIGTDVTCEQ